MILHLFLWIACCFLMSLDALADASSGSAETPIFLVKADMVYGIGDVPVQGGMVLVQGSRILGAGPDLVPPEGAKTLMCKGNAYLTPGLIDAASRAGWIQQDGSWAEHGQEVIPQLQGLQGLDLDHPGFERLAAQGVTTVYVTPDPASVIGCQGTILKTGGPFDERVVLQKAGIKATLGDEGWRRGERNRTPRGQVDYRTRRPTTRMGMGWVFREAFYDAKTYGAALMTPSTVPVQKDPALEALLEVLDGKTPFRIQARKDIDIWSAIRLCREFGLSFVLEEGIEAYKCLQEIKACGAPVIFGPLFIDAGAAQAQFRGDVKPCLNTAGLLRDAGIPFALTAGGLTGEDALPHQAGLALRFGLTFEEALKATTASPARILGIQDRVGRLEPGLDADLVLWTDRPFESRTKPALVMIHGQIVYQDEQYLVLSDEVEESLTASHSVSQEDQEEL
ncbi:MAG: amidohydrolase family protein [Planctomycetes bacterium]|nr:amidohydrolase family protein [Planctomycetota bacterium]